MSIFPPRVVSAPPTVVQRRDSRGWRTRPGVVWSDAADPTMSVPGIPENVLQFIAAKIDTVPQLEALLLLWENPQHDWSEEELAGRIYVLHEAAAAILQALHRRQLIAIT